MTLELIVSLEAEADIDEAVTRFREISPGLPARFGVELQAVFASILEHPQLYPIVYENFRRALLQRFPYSVFYIATPPSLLIVGVVHQARDENTWKRRA